MSWTYFFGNKAKRKWICISPNREVKNEIDYILSGHRCFEQICNRLVKWKVVQPKIYMDEVNVEPREYQVKLKENYENESNERENKKKFK